MVSGIMGPSFVQGMLGGSPTATVLGMLFLVQHRGETPIQGRGTIDTYFLRPLSG
jgi:hypothetical protein